MLHKPHIRRGWYATYASTALASLIFSLWAWQASAAGVVVQGRVSLLSGTGVAGVSVEFHTSNGSFSTTTTTDANGDYSFSDALTNGYDYTVEIREPSGYNQQGDDTDSHFTYHDGDAARVVDFTLIAAVKTLSGHVYDLNEQLITDADVILTPYNISGSSNIGVHTDGSGAYSVTLVGGTWFAEAAVNLSDTNFTQRWISEEQPTRVDFVANDTPESVTHDFHVTPATGRVTVQLLNSDSSYLTTSNFTADIDFRRADGVGTKRKVRAADSVVSVYLTPGIYSITAYHQDLTGKSFDPDQATFTMTAGADINLGTISAQVNSAHLKGRVTDNNKRGVNNMPIEAYRNGGSDRIRSNTQSDGTYDLTVGAGTWTVGAKNDDGHRYSQVAPVSATVSNGQTASNLNFQLKPLDKTITGSVLNSSGQVITDYVGTAFVTTLDKKYKETAAIVNGTFSINYASADIPGKSVYVGIEASDGSDYTGSGLAKVSISGDHASKNIVVKQYNATLSGVLIFTSGAAVIDPGSIINIEAVDESGNFTSAAVNNDGTFTLPLAAGSWMYDYNIEHPENTDGLLNRPAAQYTLAIAANQTKTAILYVVQGTNTITGTVTSASGAAVESATVNIDNRPAIENSGSSKASSIANVSVLTNSSGVYTAKVPDGTYLVTVGSTPEVATSIAPDGKTTTVSGRTTATVNLAFEASDATIKGKITTSGKADGGGVVDAYTDNGKEASAVVQSNGAYTLPVSKGDTWHVVVTDLKGRDLYASSIKDVKPKTSSTTVNFALADSGLNVPGPATKTCAADTTCSVSLPDGASATIPAFGIDTPSNSSDTVQLTMTPVIDMSRTTTDSPATLTYEVKAFDIEGHEVKNLQKDAEITVPYDQASTAASGLIESRLTTTYYDPNTDTWEDSGASGLVDTKHNVATIRTDHLTKFAVTGTVKAIPKVSKVAVISTARGTATIKVDGKNFKSKVSAKIGTIKASKVTLKGDSLTITFPTRGLNGYYSLTVTSGNGRVLTTAKNILVKYGRVTIKK